MGKYIVPTTPLPMLLVNHDIHGKRLGELMNLEQRTARKYLHNIDLIRLEDLRNIYQKSGIDKKTFIFTLIEELVRRD